MLIADEDFVKISVVTVGPLEPDWGFTSVKLVPESEDLVALKVLEKSGQQRTKLTVFNLTGHLLLDGGWLNVSDTVKFEGIEFL